MPIDSNKPRDPLFDEFCELTKMTSAEEICNASFNDTKVKVVKGKHRKPFRGYEGFFVDSRGELAMAWIRLSGLITGMPYALLVNLSRRGRCIIQDYRWNVNLQMLLKTACRNGREERNVRMFQDKSRSVEALTCLIKDTVRLRIMSLSLNNSTQVSEAASLWNFHVDRGMGRKKVQFHL
ncbi:hypothetical protein Tco_1269702 [Tanacetum coccineum]